MQTVIVIGAGIAGISTARALTAHGCKVIILEGRDRIGGRLFAADLGGQPVDLGAQWLQSSIGNPVTTLCTEHNIQHSHAPDDMRPYDTQGQRLSQKRLRRLEQLQDQILEECADLGLTLMQANRKDISLAAAIEQAPGFQRLSGADRRQVNWILNASINSDLAQDSHRVSLFRFLTDSQREPYHGAERLFPQGYAQLPEKLSRGLDIRLNHVVHQIAYHSDGVSVTTDRNRLQADYAVLTVPIGVLKRNRISFEPALPSAKQSVINTFGVGAAHKILIRFSDVFWPRNRRYFGWVSDEPNRFPLWVNVYAYTGAPILVLWSHGDAAVQLEQQQPAEQLKQALNSLRQVFGDRITKVTDYQVSRWQEDPFTLGAYSYLPVGAPEGMYTDLAHPVGNRLFFAGEATAGDSPATVHGAFNSGLYAAQSLLSLRP
ncbi:MAG: flavin monoamine oxidase family protein [bacterium]